MPFTAADIRELTYDPQAYMKRRQRLASGGGFGVPALWWRYGAAEAIHSECDTARWGQMGLSFPPQGRSES